MNILLGCSSFPAILEEVVGKIVLEEEKEKEEGTEEQGMIEKSKYEYAGTRGDGIPAEHLDCCLLLENTSTTQDLVFRLPISFSRTNSPLATSLGQSTRS